MTKFDDTYTGPRWTYGSLHRPHMQCGYSNKEKWIIYSDKVSVDFPAHGTAQTWQEIAPKEAERFGLVLLERIPGATGGEE